LNLMDSSRADYTNVFRTLGTVRQDHSPVPSELRDHFTHREACDDWAARYRERLRAEKSHDGERQARMDNVNPKYILRNHLVQQAITQAVQQRDYSGIDRLLNLLSDPYTEQPGMDAYAVPPPPGEPPIIVSCSS
jgi:serine/tyrosine/threonine adenylyltransferase